MRSLVCSSDSSSTAPGPLPVQVTPSGYAVSIPPVPGDSSGTKADVVTYEKRP